MLNYLYLSRYDDRFLPEPQTFRNKADFHVRVYNLGDRIRHEGLQLYASNSFSNLLAKNLSQTEGPILAQHVYNTALNGPQGADLRNAVVRAVSRHHQGVLERSRVPNHNLVRDFGQAISAEVLLEREAVGAPEILQSLHCSMCDVEWYEIASSEIQLDDMACFRCGESYGVTLGNQVDHARCPMNGCNHDLWAAPPWPGAIVCRVCQTPSRFVQWLWE